MALRAALLPALLAVAASRDAACEQDEAGLLQKARVNVSSAGARRLEAEVSTFCGNTGKQCPSCQVCLGYYHSWMCVGSCASNEACGLEGAGCGTTCKDRVETLAKNGLDLDHAMAAVAKNYKSDCGCLASPPDDCYCGNSGQQCSASEVCVGGYKSWICAGSCASNEACRWGPGCNTTCADRVKTFIENGFGLEDSMGLVACTFSKDCGCLKSYCGNTGKHCCGGDVCLGYYHSWMCVGSCASNEACGFEGAGCGTTCKDRVEALAKNGLDLDHAMASVAQNYKSDCGCLASSP